MEDLQQQLFALLNDDDLETANIILEWQPSLANSVYQTKHGGGTTLLIEACSKGRLGATKLLLKYGADIGNREPIISCGQWGHQGASHLIDVFPLIVATREGHLSIVEELLQAGAPANQTNALGQSALHACCIYRSEGSVNYPMHNECFLKLTTALMKHGANINLQDHEGKTPLHYACDPYKEYFVKILLENGAHFTLRDNNGNSALNIAITPGETTRRRFSRISANNSPYAFHFPMLCMQYATSVRLEDEAMIILLKMCEFTLKEIIELYETTGIFTLMRKATEMREQHNIPKSPVKPRECLESLKEWETLEELEAFKNDPDQLDCHAELARDRIMEEQKLNLCHILLPEILKVINTKYSCSLLEKTVRDYLNLFGLSLRGASNFPVTQDSFKLNKNHFDLLETDRVTEFIKMVIMSGQKIQKQLEIDTEPHDTMQLSQKLLVILGIVVNLIVQLLQRNRKLKKGTTKKCLVKQLLQELLEKFPEVHFQKFADSFPQLQFSLMYMKQFQQLLAQPRLCVSLPLPYVILWYGITIVMDDGPLYTETDFELLVIQFIQLGFDINATDGEGNTLLHYVVRSVLEDINSRPCNVGHGIFLPGNVQQYQPGNVQLQPGYVQPGNVRPGHVQPGHVQHVYVRPGHVQPGHVGHVYVGRGIVQRYFQPGNVPGHVRPGYVGPGYVRPGNVQPGYVQPVIVRPVYVRPGNVQLGNVQLGNVHANELAVSEPAMNIIILLLKSGAYLHAKNKLGQSALDLLQDPSNIWNFKELIQLMKQHNGFPSLQHLAAITVRNSTLPYETLLPNSLTKFVEIH